MRLCDLCLENTGWKTVALTKKVHLNRHHTPLSAASAIFSFVSSDEEFFGKWKLSLSCTLCPPYLFTISGCYADDNDSDDSEFWCDRVKLRHTNHWITQPSHFDRIQSIESINQLNSTRQKPDVWASNVVVVCFFSLHIIVHSELTDEPNDNLEK